MAELFRKFALPYIIQAAFELAWLHMASFQLTKSTTKNANKKSK